MRKDKTLYFSILVAAIICLLMAFNAKADEVTIGAAPGIPYCAELNAVMSTNDQMYLYDMCEYYGIDYALAIAIIEQESSFNVKAYNSNTVDRGLMQINKQWVSKFKRMGWIQNAQDLYDPQINIKCGTYILSEAISMYGNCERAYAYYNTGSKSVKSNKNSRSVMKLWEKWKELIKE